MAKNLRIHYSGAVYHVVARGVRRSSIFRDDDDRSYFLKWLNIARKRCLSSILAYCLMTNHFHLAVQVTEQELARMMHLLLTAYAGRFNRRHGLKGHVFEDRYQPKLCRTDVYFAAMIRYIHDNPVGPIVARPQDYKWSSYREIAARDSEIIDFAALEELGSIEDLISAGPFVKQVPRECYIDTGLCFDEKPQVVSLSKLAVELAGSRIGDMRGPSRGRDISELRKEFCRRASRLGARASEIGRFLNRSGAYVGKVRIS